MENLIDTLLEVMKKEWDAETLAMFLCNIYGLGYTDSEKGKDSEISQTFLLMSPLMQCDVVQDYILNSIGLDDCEEAINWEDFEESEEEF